MVDKRTDIDGIAKFLYLRDALKGEALSKIESFDLSEENYNTAWEELVKAYDRKRVLIS